MFRFTTTLEKIKLVIGCIAALVSGGVFPFFLLFFADITTVYDENHRDESAQRGWDLCVKFFYVGAATWISRNLYEI